MVQKKVFNLFVIGCNLFDQWQELGNQGQRQPGFSASGNWRSFELRLMQLLEDFRHKAISSFVSASIKQHRKLLFRSRSSLDQCRAGLQEVQGGGLLKAR